MKKTNVILALSLLALYISAKGQEQLKKICISDISIQTGFTSMYNTEGTLSDFLTLAPKSEILNNLLPDNSYILNNDILNNSSFFSAALGIKFREKEKTKYKFNPTLRLGFSYISGTNLNGYLSRINRKPYDTLTSSQTTETYYIDSVSVKDYHLKYSSEQLRFDGSLIFKTNPEKRWLLYTGIGITAGASINAYTKIYYNKHDYTDNSTHNDIHYPGHRDSQNYFYKNKNNIDFSAYIPIGVDFRLGKNNVFWKQMHLFTEIRPGVNYTYIPELRTNACSGSQASFGIRISWI